MHSETTKIVELKCFEASQGEEQRVSDSLQAASWLHKDVSDGGKDCCIQLIGKYPL